DLFRRTAAEPVAPQAPKAFRDATSDAATELRETEARMPHVRVVVRGAPGGDVRLLVDGAPASPNGPPLELDPGRHELIAESGAQRPGKTVTLAQQAEPVEVALVFGDAAPRAAAVTKGSLAPAIACFAVGAAGLAAGAVTGAIAAVKG